MYRQFNTQQFYVLPTQLYLCVLCGSENKQPLFPYTTQSKPVHCAVRTAPFNSSPPVRQTALLTAGRPFHETQRISQPIARHSLSHSVCVLFAQPKDFCATLAAHKSHNFPPSLPQNAMSTPNIQTASQQSKPIISFCNYISFM